MSLSFRVFQFLFASFLLLSSSAFGQSNLVLNGAFDTDLSSWGFSTELSWDSRDKDGSLFSGSAHFRANGTSGPSISQCVPVTPGETYTFSVDVLVPTGQAPISYATAALYWNNDPTCFNSTTYGTNLSGQDTGRDEWQSPSETLVAPAGMSYAEIYLGLNHQDPNTSYEAFFDNASLLGPLTTTGTCTGLNNGLCLNRDRFWVEATWRDSNGGSGTGGAVELTDDTGYFWFFNSANVEVVVKALDGCGINQNFWVFAAGLTDVEVTLTVTDMQTGQTKNYFNPLGNQFAPSLDTQAFATCR